MWTRPDPHREFWTAYRYTTNPIGFFDPNGLDELGLALFLGWNQQQAARLQRELSPYVAQGDNLTIKVFDKSNQSEMASWLKTFDKKAIGAHGGEGSFYIVDNAGGKITFDELETGLEDLFIEHIVYIDACGAEENFAYLKEQELQYQHIMAAPGASGEADVPKNAVRALGIEVEEEAWKEDETWTQDE